MSVHRIGTEEHVHDHEDHPLNENGRSTMQIGGIDANQIVTDLMSLERRPLIALEARQEAAELASRAIGGIRTNVESIRLAATKLAGSDAFSQFAASSTNSAVTASASSDAVASTLSFTVARLATSHGLRSVGTVESSDSTITSSSTISIATGNAAALGISAVRATGGLAAGDHDVTISQASEAAVVTGTALPATTDFGTGLFGDLSEFVDLEVDGVAVSVEFEEGTYTAQDIADTVDAALTAAGVDASAELDADGRLVMTTGGEGSANTIEFLDAGLLTAGTLDKIGVSVGITTGTDAIVEVGDETTTLTDITAGDTVTVTTAEGDLELDLAGGLRLGTLDVTTVDVGGGSLAEVAEAINASDAGVSGAAIRVGDDQWRLQLTSRNTGTDGEILVDDAVFSEIGGLIESSEGVNAQIVIGSGAGAYTVESSSNTFEDVMAGTSVTVSEVTTDPVTVSIERDEAAIAGDVSKMVAAVNTALGDIKVQTRFGVDGAGNGALAGNSTIRRLADQLRDSLSRPVDGVSGFIGADVGIEIDREGTFTFDSAKFEAALAADPEQVARFFGRDATTPAGLTFADATADTATGSYDVDVTVAATQATSAQLFNGGAGATTRVGVRVGDITAEVDVTAGDSAADVIDALNAALEQRGLDITAEVDGGGLVLRADEWGTAGDFELNLDVNGAGTWDAVGGVDVEGTIDGVAALGLGRTLSLNEFADTGAKGLSIDVDGGVTGALGAVDYQPGLGARVTEITTRLLDEDSTLDSAADAQQRRIDDFNDDIERFEDRLILKETNLRRTWANVQTLIESLSQRGNWISSQLASLPQIGQS